MATVITKKHVLAFFTVMILSAGLFAYITYAQGMPVDAAKGWHPLQQVSISSGDQTSIDSNDNNAVDNADLATETNTLGGLVPDNFCRNSTSKDCYVRNMDASGIRINPNGAPILTLSSGGSELAQIWADATSLRFRPFGTDRMIIDNNGNVGIGTSNPSSLLHLNDSNGIGYSRIQLTTANSGKGGAIFVSNRADNSAALWNYENSYLQFGTNDLERMRIGSNGRVGIRTTNPEEILTINVTGYGLLHTNGTTKIGTWVGSSGVYGGGWFGTKSNDPLYFFTANGDPQIILNTNGNVGIGTTPSTTGCNGGPCKLDVAGYARGQTGLCIGADCKTSWPSGMAGSGTANYISKWNSPSSLGNSTIYDDGNGVGIGTISPQAKLEVNLNNPQGWNGNTKGLRLVSPDTRYYLDINPYVIPSGNVGYNFSPNGAAGFVIGTTGGLGENWVQRDSKRNWNSVAVSSDGRYQTAVASAGGNPDYIYTSSDYGTTWTQKGQQKFWDGIDMSPDGRYQAAAADYIYVSSDYGATWTAKGSLRSWSGVAISSNGQYLTGIIQGGYIETSSDYGQTWTVRTSAPTRSWYDVVMSPDGRYQTAVTAGVPSPAGIYTSSDYGANWILKLNQPDIWTSVVMSSDGSYQVAYDISVHELYRSSDYGQNWAFWQNGDWMDIVMSPDTRYLTAVSNDGRIFVSSDYGATWNMKAAISENLRGVAMSSDGRYQTTVAYNGYIYTSDAESKQGNIGIGTINPETILDINGNSIRVRESKTPLSTSDATGKIGDIAWDDSYIYVKTNGGWKRTALTTW